MRPITRPLPKSPSDSRALVLRIFLTEGTIGILLLCVATWYFHPLTSDIIARLGWDALSIALIFFTTSVALQSLRFELTKEISVAIGLTAFIALFPLLGPSLTAWIAVLSGIFGRLGAMRQIGPAKLDMQDPLVEYVRAFALFSTYGIPVLVASTVYYALGGTFGPVIAKSEEVTTLAASGIILIATNSLVMVPPAIAYGYSRSKILKLYSIDFSIYLLTLPYAICITLSYAPLGPVAILLLCFEMIVAYAVTRKMAVAQNESRHLLQRLASLMNIGRAVSLTTTENLLMSVYTETKKVMDPAVFTIALLEPRTGDMTLELLIRDDEILPKQRFPAGGGLNGWVMLHAKPLLLTSIEDERKLGLQSLDDGLSDTESWLGVPMIARDRAIGVISVQSYKKNAFGVDDQLLLNTVANQAAVALDNAKLYEELEDLTYALEERVQERTTELHETNVQLTAADRSKNEFLAKMSHELRTPLNSIIGFSSVLIQSSREELPQRLYRFLENIHAAGIHLLNLINDILDLSKIEAGKVELRPDVFDPRDTVAAVERVMKGFAAEARVTIVSLVAPDVPEVRLDEGRLKQILFNLLSNAVKFSPVGGVVRLTVDTVPAERSPIHVRSIRVEVEDKGVGIAPEDLSNIFDEFYQTDQGRMTRRSGTGLGLSLTRNFVELHHGTIEVHSSPGVGSTFSMYLPIDVLEAAVTPFPLLSRASVEHRPVSP